MYEPEVIEVDTKNVACDGGDGALGHPRVWMPIDQEGRAVCPYCSRIFVYRPAALAVGRADAASDGGAVAPHG